MVFSQRELEGYVRIDHRESPGIPGMPFRSKGTFFEAPTMTCNHCQAVVIVNPDRTRERARCYSCDHYICDACEGLRVAGKSCRPMKQVIDELLTEIAKGLPDGP